MKIEEGEYGIKKEGIDDLKDEKDLINEIVKKQRKKG